jgi:hypothetical protein
MHRVPQARARGAPHDDERLLLALFLAGADLDRRNAGKAAQLPKVFVSERLVAFDEQRGRGDIADAR